VGRDGTGVDLGVVCSDLFSLAHALLFYLPPVRSGRDPLLESLIRLSW
jgi:hypothetical protein